MEVRVTKSVSKKIYSVLFKTTLNDTEKAKVAKFGDIVVAAGGTYTGFILPELSKKIPAEFPFVQKFDGDELGHQEAAARAATFASEFKIRIQNALTAFKAIPDSFSDEEVFTL